MVSLVTNSREPIADIRYGATPRDWAEWAVHHDLRDDLLPVVSNPNAPISPLSTLKDRGKVPSLYNRNRQIVGIKGWTSRVATDADIHGWQREGDYGICVQTRRLRGIDVDVDDRGIVDRVLDALIDTIDAPLRVRIRDNSPRVLVPLFVAGPLDYQELTLPNGAGAIEFLADGQQFIACGTHPSGARYRFTGADEFPSLEPEEFAALVLRIRDAIGATGSGARNGTRPRKRAEALAEASARDPIAVALHDKGMVLGSNADGALHVTCPFVEEHTTDTGPTSTVYFPAHTGGYSRGHFVCLHAHCRGRTDGDFETKLGLIEFPDLTHEGESPSRTAGANFLDRIRGWAPKPDAEALLTVPPVAWLVVGWLQHGLAGTLVAEGGTGKTTLLLLLGISLATGRPFLGLEMGRTGSFVLLSLDDTQDDLDAALAEVARAADLTPDELDAVRTRVRVISLRGADGVEGFARVERGGPVATGVEVRIADALLGVPDLQLVALDTLRMFAGSGSSEEQGMNIATAAVTSLCRRLDCTAIVCHHTGKGQSRDGVDDQYIAAGSSAIGDNFRFVFRLRPATASEVTDAVVITDLPIGTPLRLSSQRGSLRVKAPAPLFFVRDGFAMRPVVGRVRAPSERDEERLRDALLAIEDGATSANALQARLKLRRAAVQALVDRLLSDGLVERKGGGANSRLTVTRKGGERTMP